MKLTTKLRNAFLNTGNWAFGATFITIGFFACLGRLLYVAMHDGYTGDDRFWPLVIGTACLFTWASWLTLVRRRVQRTAVRIRRATDLGFVFEGIRSPMILACSTCWSEKYYARMNDREYQFCFGCGRTTCYGEGVRDAAAVVDEYAKDPEKKGRELAVIQHTKDRERIVELLDGIEASRTKMRIDLAELDRIPGGTDAYQLSRPQGYRIADDKRLDPNDVPAQTALERLVDHLTDETRTEPIRVVVQTHDAPSRRGKRSR